MKKYKYLTAEDLGHRPSVLEKTKFKYSPLGMSFEKDKVKYGTKSESDFNYDNKYRFYGFYKRFDEIEEMSLDSQYNNIKEFNKLLTSYELEEKYYNAYKNDYDTDDVLKEAKKKLTTNSLNCLKKQIKCQN